MATNVDSHPFYYGTVIRDSNYLISAVLSFTFSVLIPDFMLQHWCGMWGLRQKISDPVIKVFVLAEAGLQFEAPACGQK